MFLPFFCFSDSLLNILFLSPIGNAREGAHFFCFTTDQLQERRRRNGFFLFNSNNGCRVCVCVVGN